MEEKIRPKKSLGQNFLTSESALQKITETAEINTEDIVLEVGPGKGALTRFLLKKNPKKIIAIEKDSTLVDFLNENFSKNLETRQLEIINGDILYFSPENHVELKNGYKIVANIPYYITGHFIKKFLTTKNKPQKMILLVQKEVAERIVARNNKESILSISVKAYGNPKLIETVKRGSFFPSPNVDSAILLIDLSQKNLDPKIEGETEARFFKILHAGFGQKRKMILGNLENVFESRGEAENALKNCNIDPKKRAEDMKLEDWLCLSSQ